LSIVICGYLFGWKWTGLVTDANYPKRTLWDWLDLLIVPIALAIATFVLNRIAANRQQAAQAAQKERDEAAQAAQKERDEAAQAAQKQHEQKLAAERDHGVVLQAYVDNIGNLLLERDLRSSLEGDDVRKLARSLTLAALTRFHTGIPWTDLGSEGSYFKRSLIQFLYEADLLNKEAAIVDLYRAELDNANLNAISLAGANLRGADMRFADLRRADLSDASMPEAYLFMAKLSATNLSAADLSYATLNHISCVPDTVTSQWGLESGVNLSNAKLFRARLINADLTGADLTGADLTGADLTGAKGTTIEQVEQAKSLKGATMPDGQILKSDDHPDGPTFEEWLKSKGRGEDGENSGTS